jgi:hypothetical protein
MFLFKVRPLGSGTGVFGMNRMKKMAMRVVTRMHAGLGEKREQIEPPGHIFSEEEFVDARAFWTWPMFLGWDALLFPLKRDYFVSPVMTSLYV